MTVIDPIGPHSQLNGFIAVVNDECLEKTNGYDHEVNNLYLSSGDWNRSRVLNNEMIRIILSDQHALLTEERPLVEARQHIQQYIYLHRYIYFCPRSPKMCISQIFRNQRL